MAHCELARYPKPQTADVKDDCAGTGLGYLGGTALLTPDTRQATASAVPASHKWRRRTAPGAANRPITQLPVLPEGQNLERNGLRCSAYNGGVACGNVSAGVGFFVRRDRYELISEAVAKRPPPAPAEAPKTP